MIKRQRCSFLLMQRAGMGSVVGLTEGLANRESAPALQLQIFSRKCYNLLVLHVVLAKMAPV
jgi:hypothetical protein